MPTKEIREHEIVLDIEGMTCASCVGKVERALSELDAVDTATVNLATRTATVRTTSTELTALFDAVRESGYTALEHTGRRSPDEEVKAYARRVVVAVVCTAPVLWLTFAVPHLPWSQKLAWALTTVVVFYSGWPFHRAALRAARHGTTTMDTLVSIGSLAAYGYSAWADVAGRHDHYFDAAAVIITLILVGKMLEARARREAGDASRSLLERGAREATVLVDGEERRMPIEDLHPGMVALVMPGEKVPADGVVKEGSSWVDLSLLTGESVPVDVGPGDEVVGASINGHGRLLVFVTKVGANTKLAAIVRLLETAQGSKAPIQRLADRVSSIFVPIVLALAALTFAGWLVRDPEVPGSALIHAVAVLIIACPCALGLATPAAIMAGTGRAAELGVLFRGGEVFEAARGIDVVLLDKTGTVTEGQMTLLDVIGVNGATSDQALALAASVERGSEHPIAKAVVQGAIDRGIDIPGASGHMVQPGTGASGLVDGKSVRVGRPEAIPAALEVIADEQAKQGRTPIVIWCDEVPYGLVVVADSVKPEAADSIARMRSMGLDIGMVTGDRQATAVAIAKQVGIESVAAEVFPDQKVEEVAKLQADGQRVAFVGDGINDAPALALADVGIAMGTGTDVALAAAQVSLMGGSLRSAADAIELARRTYRVIQENLFWAFAYNVVMLPLAVLGVMTPAWAAAAMALSSVSVVANALRLRRFGKGRILAG